MIVLPAIVAALTPVVKAVLVSAGIGAAVSGGIGAVGGAVESYREQGEINREVFADSAHGAWNGAKDGALIGGLFGPVGLFVGPVVAPAVQVVDDIVGPVMQVVKDATRPVVQAADDVARPLVHAADDAARPFTQAADDAIRPALNGIRDRAKSFGGSVNAAFNHARNAFNARFYTRLPKGVGNSGYVYVMDDVANTGRYKIGKTIDPPTRIKAVQGKLNKAGGGKLEYSCIIPTNNMSGLENSLLKEFSAQNLRNFPAGTEWFKLNPAQLAAACSR